MQLQCLQNCLPKFRDAAVALLPRITGLTNAVLLDSIQSFFLRLPNGQYGPVSRMFQPKTRHCTGPFNWGGAHCAGEKMKRKTGPFLQKPHQKQARSKQGTARHGNQEPGQAPRYTGQEANNTTQRDFEHRSRYALTYIEVFRTCANPIMYCAAPARGR